MPSITSRIDALVELLGASPTAEPRTDFEIARSVCHVLTVAAMTDEITDHTLALAEHFAPDGTTDFKAWLKAEFTPKDDHRDEMRWAAWKAAQKNASGIHAGSSLESLVSPTSTTTRIVTQRSPERDVTSGSFERERANNI